MGKSFNPMWCSFNTQGEAFAGSASGPIVLMSLQSAIPWRVALQQSPPPLHRLDSRYHSPAETVNHHLTRAGEFSTGIMRNFQPVLTRVGKTNSTGYWGRAGRGLFGTVGADRREFRGGFFISYIPYKRGSSSPAKLL